MSTTYFKSTKSNIDKLTKKSKKNKDKGDDTENDKNDKTTDDKVIIEGLSMNPFASKNNDSDSKDKPKKTEKEKDPMSNVFSSSDKKSPTSKTETNTEKSAKEQLNSDKFIIFFLHALMCVFIAYVWGFLATNYLYLSTESKDNLDYILPIEEYKLPYTNDPDSKSFWSYGFPYELGDGRSIDTDKRGESKSVIQRRQKDTTYFLWLSKTGESNNLTGTYKSDFFEALVQYLFEAVYGGLGKGGRRIIRNLLAIVGVVDINLKDNEDSWKDMKDNFPRKAIAFILFPYIALNFLIPAIAMWTIVTTFTYGIIQKHIWWGMVFSFTIGMFIAMGCGIYMGIQTFYIFFLYPWISANKNDTSKWGEIFNSLKTYMLFVFYLLICFYGYEDLGSAGGAGIMFIVVASIIMQWTKGSDDKK